MKLPLIMGCVMLLVGCQQSVFKPDLLDARLPRFSASGNNVGGALIDGSAWNIRHTCREDDDTASICKDQLIVSRDSTFIRLEMEEGELYDEVQNTKVPAGIAFMITDSVVESIYDLEEWSGREIVLDGIENSATVTVRGIEYTASTGKLFIRAAYSFYGGYSLPRRTTLAGTFAFSLPNNYPFSQVTSGRFDFEVSEVY